MKATDLLIAAGIFLIIILIVIPLSPILLDFFLIISISMSVMVLLMSLFTKETLEFSVFPSLLLIMTLFRLALNISSTRLILGNSGEAGAVIKTFGNFVIGGNLIVGIIILQSSSLFSSWSSQRVLSVSLKWRQGLRWTPCPVSRWRSMPI